MQQSSSLGQRPRLLLQGSGAGLRISPFEIIVLLAVLVGASYGGYTVYARTTDLNAPLPPSPLYLPASRTTLTSSVSATGTVQASQQVTLTFGSSGKIKEFLVGLGAQVTAGQPLARLDDTDLQQSLRSAESALASAQARLAAARGGPKETDIASAVQAVVSARSQLATAEQNLADLLVRPTSAEIASAEQAVATAQSALQTANDAVPKAQNDLAAAQSSLRNAEDGVSIAQNNLTSAQAAVTTAQSNLAAANSDAAAAETALRAARQALSVSLINLQTEIAICGNPSIVAPSLPSGSSQASTMLPLLTSLGCTGEDPRGSPAPKLDRVKSYASAYNSAAAAYNSALSTSASRKNAVASAETALRSAENGVLSAQAAVSRAQGDVAAAQRNVSNAQNALTNGNLLRAIQNAQLGLSTALQKQKETLAGATGAEIDAATRAIDGARASLTSAEARYAELFKPPAADVLLPLQATVDQAAANVETARKDLAAATIVAPFDGQISQLTGEVGSQVSATTAVFILLNPTLIRVDANVDQADISNLQAGQTANVTFDALSGRTYQAVVSAIGLTPTIQQGVVTYVVSLAVDTTRLAPGTPVPTPGMTASITVTTARAENALVVPSRSIRRSGRTSSVTVKTDSGEAQRQVTTGLSNGTLTQVTGGLQEGDLVLYSTPVTASSAARPTTQGGGNFFVPGGGGPTGPITFGR